MLNLAIECSGTSGSVAIAEGAVLIAELPLPRQVGSVQCLAQAIRSALNPLGKRPQLISVTQGPGSFTGLRVGLTTAKMLGYAWNLPIAAVDTLEVLAHQVQDRLRPVAPTIIVPVMNAFRQQVFTAAWHVGGIAPIVRLAPSQVLDAADWRSGPLSSQTGAPLARFHEQLTAAGLSHVAPEIVIAGPGLAIHPPQARDPASEQPLQILAGLEPQAGWVAQVGWRRWLAGQTCSPAELTAHYIRASAAEENSRP